MALRTATILSLFTGLICSASAAIGPVQNQNSSGPTQNLTSGGHFNSSVWSGDGVLFASDATNEVSASSSAIATDSATAPTLNYTTTDVFVDRYNPPPPYLRVTFRNFRVNVFNDATPGFFHDPVEAGIQYYYEPALFLDPTAMFSRLNPFTNSTELILPVFMWDDMYQNTIEQAVAVQLGIYPPSGSVQMIKFDSILLDTYLMEGNFTVQSQYMTYINRPGVVNFRVVCGDLCLTIQQKILQAPDYFVDQVKIYYYIEAESKTSNIVGTLKLMGRSLRDYASMRTMNYPQTLTF